MPLGSGFHHIPLRDYIGHDAMPDCVCGPDVHPEEDADDPTVVHFVFTHHALDGRKPRRNAA